MKLKPWGEIKMVEKIRPNAIIVTESNDDGWRTWKAVEYHCPTCNHKIRGYMKETACDQCGTFYDWSKEAKIETIYQIKWS